MALTRRELAEAIEARIHSGRSFGRHPVWLEIAAGKPSREQLKIFAAQFFLQVVEFPRAVSALHTNCPHPEERRKLAENLYEEETGSISGSASHPELFLRFSRALGLTDDEMWRGRPLPGTAALIDWFELSSRNRPFVEGAAAITLAAEGQVVGKFGPFARHLERHYGLSPEQVSFWDVHEQADADHSDVGDHIVMRFATSDDVQRAVLDAIDHSLAMWWQFFDDIGRAMSR
jgi:pyrroloquinoline-quinone synthase